MQNISLTKRTFLKIASAIAGGLAITKYADTFEILSDESKDWVEDRGDFYILRVPDFKTFKNETLNKPTIILMGEKATVEDVQINGFLNLHAPKSGTLQGCYIDASKCTMDKREAAVLISDTTGDVYLGNNRIIGSKYNFQLMPHYYLS